MSMHKLINGQMEQIAAGASPFNGAFRLGAPDYARMETVNRITADHGTWTADRNGYVAVLVQNITAGQSAICSINGKWVGRAFSGVGNGAPGDVQAMHSGVYPVRAGDVVELFAQSGTVNTGNLYCYYIPPVEEPVPLPPSFTPSDDPGYVSLEAATGRARANPPGVQLAAAKKYTNATTALKFKFKREGFSVPVDKNVFYRVKARIRNTHSKLFFDLDAAWIPQDAAYDSCAINKYNFPDGALPAMLNMSNDEDGFFAWIPLATAASYHWEASAEMWAADTANSVITGVYKPEITFEASNPAAGRTKAAALVSVDLSTAERLAGYKDDRGKDVYIRTFRGNVPATAANTGIYIELDPATLNMEGHIIKAYGEYQRLDNQYKNRFLIPYAYFDNAVIQIDWMTTAFGLRLIMRFNYAITNPAQHPYAVTVEYTKE